MEKINIGQQPNDKTGDPIRVAGQKINQNFNFIDNNVIYKDNLGDIGFPPVINQDGAIEALVSHRIEPSATIVSSVLADGELAIERDGTRELIRVGDGVTAGGKRIAGRQRIVVSTPTINSDDWQTIATLDASGDSNTNRFRLTGRVEIINTTGDTVLIRFQGLGIAGTNAGVMCLLKKGAAPLELVFAVGIGGGQPDLRHDETFEVVFLGNVAAAAASSTPVTLQVRKLTHTSGSATIRANELVLEPL